MAKQTFTTGQVLTAAQMTSLQQTAMGGGSASTKTASYVLVAADAGTVIQMNSASATTITVNTSLFSAGDSVQIQNIGTGTCTITAGTATVNSAGSLAVTQYDGGFLYFSSASSAIWFDYTQPGTTSPLTTKGDLYTRTSSADARLGVGTNGQTLVADSAEATGLKWATPASGGGMTLISETVASALSSLSLSSIPNTYKQLVLIWFGVYHSDNGSTFSIRFNNDSTVDAYPNNSISGSGATGFYSQAENNTYIVGAGANFSLNPFGQFTNNSTTAVGTMAQGFMTIDNYASTTKRKNFQTNFGYYKNAGTTGYGNSQMIGQWLNTSAISSIDIFRAGGSGTFSNATNTSIRLYGVS